MIIITMIVIRSLAFAAYYMIIIIMIVILMIVIIMIIVMSLIVMLTMAKRMCAISYHCSSFGETFTVQHGASGSITSVRRINKRSFLIANGRKCLWLGGFAACRTHDETHV